MHWTDWLGPQGCWKHRNWTTEDTRPTQLHLFTAGTENTGGTTKTSGFAGGSGQVGRRVAFEDWPDGRDGRTSQLHSVRHGGEDLGTGRGSAGTPEDHWVEGRGSGGNGSVEVESGETRLGSVEVGRHSERIREQNSHVESGGGEATYDQGQSWLGHQRVCLEGLESRHTAQRLRLQQHCTPDSGQGSSDTFRTTIITTLHSSIPIWWWKRTCRSIGIGPEKCWRAL